VTIDAMSLTGATPAIETLDPVIAETAEITAIEEKIVIVVKIEGMIEAEGTTLGERTEAMNDAMIIDAMIGTIDIEA
jgi:hypothetical protein